jgi:hypothetical protein
VAVSPDGSGRALGDYMWCPLLKEPGKIVTGEPINIIQHPKGERKQVVIPRVLPIQAASGSCKSLVRLASLFLVYFLGAAPRSASEAKFLVCRSR